MVAEVPVVADDLRTAEPVEHRPALPVVAAVGVDAGVDGVRVADVGPDRGPVVGLLEDGLLTGVGPRGVSGDEDRLRHRHVDVLQEREEQRGASRIPDEHRVLVEPVVRRSITCGRI
ncbi:hypothetical protein [Actinoallomurus sp. NPDC052274]|uniref:hypothetical protein n=1 Tax=Actinoallomurus sp. NPDC052274 TaxID=3155420 RepID=UPI003442C2DA